MPRPQDRLPSDNTPLTEYPNGGVPFPPPAHVAFANQRKPA